MQKAIENIAAGSSLTTTNPVVVSLGDTGAALTAAESAFNLSSLAGSGDWTFLSVTDLTAATFASSIASAGIINIGGGLTDAEKLVLTANSAAFLGLNNGDLSVRPWYDYLTGVGSIPVLASGVNNFAVVIGAAGGSITDPIPAIPEPSTYALMALGLAGMAAVVRHRKTV